MTRPARTRTTREVNGYALLDFNRTTKAKSANKNNRGYTASGPLKKRSIHAIQKSFHETGFSITSTKDIQLSTKIQASAILPVHVTRCAQGTEAARVSERIRDSNTGAVASTCRLRQNRYTWTQRPYLICKAEILP